MKNTDKRNEHLENRFDKPWESKSLWTTGRQQIRYCMQGSIIYRTAQGRFTRASLPCGSWKCQYCARKRRRDKLHWLQAVGATDSDRFFFSRDVMLTESKARRAALRRIRSQGGGYALVKHQATEYTIVTNTDFRAGYKYDVKVGKVSRYVIRDALIDNALKLPGLLRVDFGGCWRRPKKEHEDNGTQFVALSNKLGSGLFREIMLSLGATGGYAQWSPPSGMSADDFQRRLLAELKAQGLWQQKKPKQKDLDMD